MMKRIRGKQNKKKIILGILIIATLFSIGYACENLFGKKEGFERQNVIVALNEKQKAITEENNDVQKDAISEEDKAVTENLKVTTLKEEVKPSIKLKDNLSNAIFIGDSITYGFKEANNTSVSKNNVYAKVGAHCFEGIKLLGNNKELIQKKCNGSVDYIFIMYGANDYSYAMSSYKDWYKKLIEHIKEMFPDAQIIVQSVMPMNNSKNEPNRSNEPAKLNQVIQEITNEEGVKYLDVSSNIPSAKELHVTDGLHFKSALYPLWVKVIKDNIK